MIASGAGCTTPDQQAESDAAVDAGISEDGGPDRRDASNDTDGQPQDARTPDAVSDGEGADVTAEAADAAEPDSPEQDALADAGGDEAVVGPDADAAPDVVEAEASADAEDASDADDAIDAEDALDAEDAVQDDVVEEDASSVDDVAAESDAIEDEAAPYDSSDDTSSEGAAEDATGFTYGVDGQSCSGGLTCAGKSCCDRAVIPAGSFMMGRSDTGTDAFASGGPDEVPEHVAVVSEYSLDLFEVTVGRFRKFVSAFDGTPPAIGAGADPQVPESGWKAEWNVFLPASSAALAAAIQCSPTGQTWTDTPSDREDKPINCLNWYEAFAFCLWDGGRLPTEEEWEYAAAGGSENRMYPWGAASPSPSLANTSCVDPNTCGANAILAVGALPSGAGRWGHQDLSGNLWEWNLDWYKWDYYTLLPAEGCVDCACLDPPVKAFRSARGGAFDVYPDAIRSAKRGRASDDKRFVDVGLRCAR